MPSEAHRLPHLRRLVAVCRSDGGGCADWAGAAVTAHTPGPWKTKGPFHADIAGPDGRDVAVAVAKEMATLTIPCGADSIGPGTRKEAHANARLIAAAPCLLEMLERIRDDRSWRTNDNALRSDLLAAIAKATGETK